MKTRTKKLTLLSLILAFFLSIAGFFCVGGNVAEAAETTYSTTSTYWPFVAESGASLRATPVDEENKSFFTTFNYGNNKNARMNYRRNLAYRWFSEGQEQFFNLTIGFPTTNFQRFIVRMQSQEANVTEEGVATNYVVFLVDQSNLFAFVTDDEKTATEAAYEDITATMVNVTAYKEDIQIRFTEKTTDGYKVAVGDAEGATVSTLGEVKNIAGDYAKYVSSSSTNATIPLSFSVVKEDTEVVNMYVKQVNGQSLLLKDCVTSGDYYTGGVAVDDKAPILVLEKGVSVLKFGSKLSIDYTLIDVFRSSPSSDMMFYTLENATMQGATVESLNTTDSEKYTAVTSKSNILLLDSPDGYLTTVNAQPSGVTTKALVKVLVKVYDRSDTTSRNEDTVFIDWYVEDSNKAKVALSDGLTTVDFIRVGTDEEGVTYKNDLARWDSLVAEYQAKIDKVTLGEDGSYLINAGSKTNVYLPDIRSLIETGNNAYEDLKISIYYRSKTGANSRKGLSTNNLYINATADGEYVFTFYVTDSSDNKMKYWDMADAEWKEVNTSDIWSIYDDDDQRANLPWFTFTVGYQKAEIEKEDSHIRENAYIDTEYHDIDFKINGVDGTYNEIYTLYRVDRKELAKAMGVENLTYSYFAENVETIFDNSKYELYFEQIPESSTLNENDATGDYEKYFEYRWNAKDVSFVPQAQDENSFLVVRLELASTDGYKLPSQIAFATVLATKAVAPMPGESNWIEENLVSFILLCVGGAALLGIVVLLVVQPKQDVDLAEEVVVSTRKKLFKKKAKKDETDLDE